jgi:hypothetical protein
MELEPHRTAIFTPRKLSATLSRDLDLLLRVPLFVSDLLQSQMRDSLWEVTEIVLMEVIHLDRDSLGSYGLAVVACLIPTHLLQSLDKLNPVASAAHKVALYIEIRSLRLGGSTLTVVKPRTDVAVGPLVLDAKPISLEVLQKLLLIRELLDDPAPNVLEGLLRFGVCEDLPHDLNTTGVVRNLGTHPGMVWMIRGIRMRELDVPETILVIVLVVLLCWLGPFALLLGLKLDVLVHMVPAEL